MNTSVIRAAMPRDRAAVTTLYPLAFSEEDLTGVVGSLWNDPSGPSIWVAEVAGEIVGHIAFSPCVVSGDAARVSLLAPLAIHPDHQRQGFGRALIEAGCQNLAATGVAAVYVLGDPAYYSRVGFTPDRRVSPPYPLPDEWADAWQSRALVKGTRTGKLQVPDCWKDPALWTP